jgi:hypothetical protein
MAIERICKNHGTELMMNRFDLNQMTLGWFIGNFTPSLYRNDAVEVGVKKFKKGDTEPMHFQMTATEWTCVIQGRVRIGQNVFEVNEIAEIPPLESADFEALEDCLLVVVKSPSNPNDKVST